MRSKRSVIDYTLARRALLADLYAGRVSCTDACDAHPYLLRAARYHGEPAGSRCPVCRRTELTNVTYVYGDELRESAGRAIPSAALPDLAGRVVEADVYVVEVCRECSWNHLVTSFRIGEVGLRSRRADGGARRGRGLGG